MKVNFPVINQQYTNPNFKSNITFDIGGSRREGSCKIYYASTPIDEEFYHEHTSVNELGRSKFKNEEQFIDLIINKIKRIQDVSKGVVKEKGYDASENVIKNVAIFLPSYTSGNVAFYFPNLRNDNDDPLNDIDFSNIKERLRKAGVEVSDNMQFKLMQDAMGTGLAMTQRLYDNNMLEEGNLYTACITGGGCGIANIEAIDDKNVIIKSSGSSYLSHSLSLHKVSKAGASAPAVIENYCKAMGYNEKISSKIKDCHLAEFVLNDSVTFDKNIKTDKLKEYLLKTDTYDIVEDDNDSYTLKIKDEFKSKALAARRNAIDKYCLALARLAIIKKTEGSNGMIVTGILAQGIDAAARKNFGIGISEWVMQHLTQSFNSYELDKLQKVYKFNVFCDNRFFIDNNTACNDLIHKAKRVGQNRSNWLRISFNDLKNYAKQKALLRR